MFEIFNLLTTLDFLLRCTPNLYFFYKIKQLKIINIEIIPAKNHLLIWIKLFVTLNLWWNLIVKYDVKNWNNPIILKFIILRQLRIARKDNQISCDADIPCPMECGRSFQIKDRYDNFQRHLRELHGMKNTTKV